MKYIVCTDVYGHPMMLNQFDYKDDALHFMKYPCVLWYKDEIENGENDEIIQPEDMYLATEPGEVFFDYLAAANELVDYDMPF